MNLLDAPVPQPIGKGLSKIVTSSKEELLLTGALVAKSAKPGQIYLLRGPIGSGKTTFVKGFLQGMLSLSEEVVSSPTFQYVNLYGTEQKICHFDLYRLESASDFVKMGFGDFFEDDSICLVEWPEVLDEWLHSRHAKSILFLPMTEHKRQIILPSDIL